uniref:Uncharacterized protein n=1 Tax=Rhizophora mucronata TaxID=61149 RepID=A0A2P2NYV4_RHIMU
MVQAFPPSNIPSELEARNTKACTLSKNSMPNTTWKSSMGTIE